MDIRYDKKADAIYILFDNIPYSYGKSLDDERHIDYGDNGEVRGVELLCVSEGVITDDLPNRAEIERALEDRVRITKGVNKGKTGTIVGKVIER